MMSAEPDQRSCFSNGPMDIIKVFESDFSERASEDCCMSREDLHFLSKMKDGRRLNDDGHYEMPLWVAILIDYIIQMCLMFVIIRLL